MSLPYSTFNFKSYHLSPLTTEKVTLSEVTVIFHLQDQSCFKLTDLHWNLGSYLDFYFIFFKQKICSSRWYKIIPDTIKTLSHVLLNRVSKGAARAFFWEIK